MMRSALAQAIALIGVLAALSWTALPAVGMACTPTGPGAGDACTCCEVGLTAGGGAACASCQPGTTADHPARSRTAAAVAWLAVETPGIAGIDPAPDEPRPR